MVESVAWGAAVTAVTYIVVAVIGEVVCSTMIADADRDLPGCWPRSWQLGMCMQEEGNGDGGHLVLTVVAALSLGGGRGVLVLRVGRVGVG